MKGNFKGLSIILGVLLLVVSFAGIFFIAKVVNPPAQEALVALRTIEKGESISADNATITKVLIQNINRYLNKDNIDAYRSAILIEPVLEGELIPISKLSTEANAGQVGRVALSLPKGKVAMTIPVNPLSCPQNIVIGDVVSLNVSVGSASFLTGEFSSVPAVAPYDLSGAGAPQYAGIIPTLQQPLGAPTVTPTPEPRIMLPVSKTLVRFGLIVDIVYEETLQAAFSNQEGDAAQVARGDMVAIVVSVDENVQEALTYGINNGVVQVSVLSSVTEVSESNLTPGMSWDDFVAYYRIQLYTWALTPQPLGINEIEPPGANALIATIVATLFPTATEMPEPTLTDYVSPTPTPTEIGAELTQAAIATMGTPTPTETPAAQ